MLDSTTPLMPSVEHPVGVKALFAEVSSLAIRLKVAPVAAPGEDTFASGGLSVLHVLAEHGPQTVPQIARLRGTSRQNIQILVNRLETDGCVELSSNPAHKRSGLVQLTGPGRDLFGRAAEQEDRFLAGLAGRVSAGEVASATSLLHQFRLMLTQAERPGEVSVAAKVPENKPGYLPLRPSSRSRHTRRW
jgi:DNA-binding MarR family transcriptional regulator